MKKNEDGNRKQRRFFPDVIMLACIVLLLAFFLFYVYREDRRAVSDLADETIEFLETVCQRYDNYASGENAVILNDILDKAEGLRDFVSEGMLEDGEFLQNFVQTMGLTGVLLTDEQLNVTEQVDINGEDPQTLWKSYLSSKNKRDIIHYKKKTFSGKVTIGSDSYHFAIVSRKDMDGLLLCYANTDSPATDLYKVSLEQTLTNNTFHKNPRIVITNGKKIVASNTIYSQGKSVSEETPVHDVSSGRWKYGDMIRLQWNGEKWYGKRQVYRQYYIYVFYPSSEVFTNLLPVVTTAIAVYAVLCMVTMMMRRSSEKKYLRREKQQLSTIKAISSLFATSSILHLKEQKFEKIQLTRRSQEVLDQQTEAKKVVEELAKRIIAPEFRQEYITFLDVNTMEERLAKTQTGSIVKVFKDINQVWHAVYLVAVRTGQQEEIRDVLVLSRNINDYKKKEEEYQEELKKTARDAKLANAAKSSFLRRMSHDVRTPVNAIRGMAVIAQKFQNDAGKVDECMEHIISSSDYLLELLDDVLRMGQLESGKIAYEEKPYNMKEVISETAAFIEQRAKEKQIHFHMEILEMAHFHVIGSPLHLRQVLQNVMSNSVKFTHPGGNISLTCREISVRHTKEKEIGIYEFVCKDNGIGISKEFQNHVFDIFAQEENSARTNYNYLGSGLGLPIAKEILEQRGGTIDFVSEKGKGSIFTIRIPLQIDMNFYHSSEESERELPVLVSMRGMKIMVAEDNELNMEIARCLLEEEGAMVIQAHDGCEAVEIFSDSQEGEFDVILMDIMMPRMDGLKAARTIRELDRPDAKEVLIFAMTANAFIDDRNRSLEAGMNEHFSKPLDINQIKAAICKYRKMPESV